MKMGVDATNLIHLPLNFNGGFEGEMSKREENV